MKNEHKAPLFHIAKRDDMPGWQAWLIRVASILAALLLGCVLLLALGHNPLEIYRTMLSGCFGSKLYIKQTIKLAIPLLGTAVAIAPAFKMKFWNIGAEGQITMGAIFATFFAINCSNAMPKPVLLLAMMLAGAVGGGLWALIPAAFKAKWDTNETLFTLMLNYIAIGFTKYLQGGPWEKMPKGTQQIAMFDDAARLPDILGITSGWVFALAMVVFMFCYMKFTQHGYQIAVVGESPQTARYAGISVSRVIIRTVFISGALAGIVGFIMVSGINYTLSSTVAGGTGFTAITVAWLAQLNTFAMILISMLLAILTKGASTIQTVFGIPESLADMLSGMILFCMLGSEFFVRYRLTLNRRKSGKEAE